MAIFYRAFDVFYADDAIAISEMKILSLTLVERKNLDQFIRLKSNCIR